MLNFDHKAKVFKEENLQKEFNDQGYVILDFLTAPEIHSLHQFYLAHHAESVQGFYTSTFSKDTAYRKEVDTLIRSVMKRGLEQYFANYKIHCGSYIVKGTDEKSVLKMHQDMTLVDESLYTGINIWIPLIDLTNTNGAIEVLPKSHRLFKTYRGASLPDIYDGIEPSVYKVMRPCYLKGGQAIVFDQSIIHYSPANLSDQARPVVNTFITHQDAKIKICYWDRSSGKNEIELFDQEDDFMVNFQNFGHDIFSRPSIGRSIGFVPFDFPKITPELLQKEYGLIEPEKANNSVAKEKPFFQLFKKIFAGT
jgi:hypothetical protein